VDGWGRVHPGSLERVLVVSALPAFCVGIPIVVGLGRIGISQVSSVMVSMPPLIFVWFFLVGWLVDRRNLKRSERTPAQVTD
jgi:hypothetical protein